MSRPAVLWQAMCELVHDCQAENVAKENDFPEDTFVGMLFRHHPRAPTTAEHQLNSILYVDTAVVYPHIGHCRKMSYHPTTNPLDKDPTEAETLHGATRKT